MASWPHSYSDNERIAKDPNSDPALLRQLAEIGDLKVREKLALNPSTPSDVLIKFTKGGTPQLIYFAIANPGLPNSRREEIILDPEHEEHNTEACFKAIKYLNPIRPEIRDRIMARKITSQIVRLAENPNIDRETEGVLINSGSSDVRVFLASNPNVSTETLVQLLDDGSDVVREVAQQALNKRDVLGWSLGESIQLKHIITRKRFLFDD